MKLSNLREMRRRLEGLHFEPPPGKDRRDEYTLKIRAVSSEQADFIATSSIPAYFAGELNIECSNQTLLDEIRLTDLPFDPSGYGSFCRQQFHFSSSTGWLNDPNGLFYFQGTHHLFYQHHPFGGYNAQQHWGYAVSSDWCIGRRKAGLYFSGEYTPSEIHGRGISSALKKSI